MKITAYPSTKKLSDSDALLIDGSDGTRHVPGSDIPFAIADLASVYMHRIFFRGKNLGTSVSVEQKSAIQNGTFEDLFLGDYWEIGGVKYRIGDFDYWYGTGDTETTSHHVVVMPDSNLGTAAMNGSASTNGGYIGSAMYTANMAPAKSTITSAFGSNVLSHREYLINAVTSGYPSAGAWTDSTIELLNEPMIFGSYIYTPSGNGVTNVKLYTNSATQLALFRVCPQFICKPDGATRISYWLRDVVNRTSFVRVSNYGAPQDTSANQSYGIRPVFAIG